MQAVLAGQVMGQISDLSAAGHVRTGTLLPLLLQHMSDHIGVHLYYGSRTAQPKRVRAFIDLATQRLQDTSDYVLTAKELKAAAAKRKPANRR